jgi:hypothetical protein
MWTDDPVFDHFEQNMDGVTVRGDAWRRATLIKEANPGAKVVKVAGTTFRPTEEIGAAMRIPNPKVTLVPEPEHLTDPNAVRVLVGYAHGSAGHFIGYLPKGSCIPADSRAHILKMGSYPNPNLCICVEA